MLRLIGALLLVTGTTGTAFCITREWKGRLKCLRDMRELLSLLQGEILYSRVSLPEACARIAFRAGEPFRSAFENIHRDMVENQGCSFMDLWVIRMGECLGQLPVTPSDRENLLSFADCVGYIDGRSQAEAMERYIHHLNQSITSLEKEMQNKTRIIMSFGIMSGLFLVIVLI